MISPWFMSEQSSTASSTGSLTDFSEIELPPSIIGNLQNMSVLKPTDIQARSIPVGISGQDMIVISQTGSGKTLAFALTILANFAKNPETRALVLVPSREMAMQISKVFQDICVEAPISSCLVIGGIPTKEHRKHMNKIPRLIIATPGRLNDLLENNKLLLQKVSMVVIDEADRMLDLGFSSQLMQIQKTMRGIYQTMLFSASFGSNVETIAKIFMREKITIIRGERAETPVETLKQKVIFLATNKKNSQLLEELKATTGSVLLFAGSQGSCEKVGEYLLDHGFSADYMHGGFLQKDRSRIIANFREEKTRILVTTDLLARGIDVPSVTNVINWDLPFEVDDFLHRIGRTARAGRSGTAITFITPEDRATYKKLKSYLAGAHEITISNN